MLDGDLERIRGFWDSQAHAFGANPRATTPDYWLHEVEIRHISAALEALERDSLILDIGCGNGYSTLALAAGHPRHRFVGGDYSKPMIQSALASLAERPDLVGRVAFDVRDVLTIGATEEFDVVISDRCLINLPSAELQFRAVDQIGTALRPGGTYIAIENFQGSQARLNEQRQRLGLPSIPIRWHNLFLDEGEFIRYCQRTFDVMDVSPISSTYYLVTRLVYSKLCQLQGVEPGYDHPIYEIAASLPPIGDLGPVKLVRFVKRG